jgi:antirestriction protein ArdC
MGFPRHCTSANADYTRRDHYQEVTDKIIEALEGGVMPWRRPWNPDLAGADALPRNATTRRRYHGINVLMLGLSPFAWSTGDNRWCSYKQAAERGWQVRKGERGTTVFFFKKLAVKDGAPSDMTGGSGEERFIPMLRAYTVFHASQIDGIPAAITPKLPDVTWRRPEAVETIVRNSGATVRVGGGQAFYSPGSDHIQMPPHETFESPASYAATKLHELGHWTGAKHRLDRDMTGRFGTASYAAEELRVEVASALMCAELGLPCEIPNHASYLQSWLGKLREDKREIFRAAAAAQRIADYCLAFHPDYRDGDGDPVAATDEIEETKMAA